MHRHGNLQATADTYAREGPRGPAGRPLPLGRQAVLRLRTRQLADVPVLRRGHRDPRTGSPDASGHCPSRRQRATDAVLRQPGLRRRPARRRSAGRDVRLRAVHRDGGRGAPGRPAASVLRPVRAPRARRHRLDRGVAHLPVQYVVRPAPRLERRRGARLRGEASRRPRCRGHGRRHSRIPARAGPVNRERLLAAGGRDGRRVRRWMAAHGRRLRPLERRPLDVPRPQQRHDQGRRDVGVAGRGRGRAGRAPRRPRGGGRGRPQRIRAWKRRWPSSCRVRARRSTPPRSTPTAVSGWPRSSGRGG